MIKAVAIKEFGIYMKVFKIILRSIRKVDNFLFDGDIRKKLRSGREKKWLRRIEEKTDYKLVSYYQKNNDCLIASLCDKYGSDKGELRHDGHPYPWSSHNYSDFYSRLFWHCRDSIRNVFECGIGRKVLRPERLTGISATPGASLRVWRDFFPTAMIYGADIDTSVLFEEDRIKTFFVDQLNPTAINACYKAIGIDCFDLIIDDGLHTFEAGSTLFLHSIDRLGENGIYIIEDVSRADLLRYYDFFRYKDYTVEYVCLHRPSLPLGDNMLVVIRKR